MLLLGTVARTAVPAFPLALRRQHRTLGGIAYPIP